MKSLVLWTLLCFTPTLSSAQTTATVTGVVVDFTDGALPGAQVMLTLVETGAVRQTVTGAAGRFALSGLLSGVYDLRVSLDGFRPLVQTGLQVSVGDNTALRLTLQVGTSEEVTVNAGAGLVNTRSAELSHLVDERTLGQIPVNGRNFTDLMTLLPGVSPFNNRDNGSIVAHGLAMSVNGQNPRSNVYLLDGTLLNDFTNGPAGSAAGTALGMETVREFRVQANSYSAEHGRNVGGQINVITKSGTNQFGGSAFEFHRNDALDARNVFDVDGEPDFSRNQFGATLGGPVARDRLFVFLGYEGLFENLGRTIVSTVPDDAARQGVLPSGTVDIDAAVLPYLLEFPVANGPSLGGGLAEYTFPFDQTIDQHFLQGRIDAVIDGNRHAFARYTLDDAEQVLPTDFPQFPRAFVSRNQFLTGEFRQVLSSNTFNTLRFGFSRTRIGQSVESNTTQDVGPFVPGRPTMGPIDIGGIPRFGPQLSADVQLDQDVFSGQYDLDHSRGNHLIKVGALVEHYRASEFNPTFSRGLFRFANLESFLTNSPALFIGLTPEGDVNREWNWNLLGAYVQDQWQAAEHVTVDAGVRLEWASVPVDPRDVNLQDLLGQPAVGPLYQNPGVAVSPRLGLAWDVRGNGRTSIRAGYGLFHNLNTQQELIVTVTNPPVTPRVVIGRPTFPVPPFERGGSIAIRPIQFDIDYARVQQWNLNLQQAFWSDWVATIGYAGARGTHLWRNADVNVPVPETLADGTLFYAAGLLRPNDAFSAIELKSSDGDSWYRALILEIRRRWSNGFQFQSSYTWSRSEDTTQSATFFSDSTTSSVSALPEFLPGYNKGRSDFDAEHNWVANFIYQIPAVASLSGLADTLLNDWQVSGITRVRSGNPLTVFVQTNRSRSLWAPSLGPGTGPDRPSYAPGRGPDGAVTGDPDAWFDPTAFVLQPAGTFGSVGRNDLIGPDFRTVDLALTKAARLAAVGPGARLEVRVEIFNLFNRTNYGAPALVAFAGTSDDEEPLSSFGRIRSTASAARQVQLGARIVF